MSNDNRGHVKFLVYYITKGDRSEERTLVFTNYSIQLSHSQGAATRSVVKIEHIIPFIDILSIESSSREKLSLTVSNATHHIITRSAENVDDVYLMVKHIVDALQQSFPSVVVERSILKMDLSYGTRATEIESHLSSLRQKIHVQACGGFKASHEYFRLYFNAAKQDEVVWDVETVYVSQNTKRITLRDFDHLDCKDWMPIVACIAFNSYFTELDVSNLKLNNECQAQVIHVLKRNKNIEALYMDGCGLKSDFCQKLGQVVTSENRLSVLDLSNNPGIEDRGLSYLCGLFSKLKKTLTIVKLRGCALTARSANYLGEALIATSNSSVTSILRILDLSYNSLKGEDLQSFYHFLAQPNSIAELYLSHCDCALDGLFHSLVRGCTANLTILDLSFTIFSLSVPPSWSTFFQTALLLRTLNLSHTRLGHQAMTEMLDSLNKNILLQPAGVDVDISGNDLKSVGADLLARYLPDNSSISNLNISDNDFNYDLIKVFQALEQNSKLTHLTIGANFNGLKSKQIVTVLEHLSQLITTPNSSMSHLSLADAKLKGDLYVLIDELANHTNLRHLNISGNLMGDVAARILSRVLCVNTTLEELVFDRNNLSLRSIEEIVGSLDYNYTLQRLVLPINDLSPFVTKFSERVTQLVNKSSIVPSDSIMKRNHGPKKYSTEKALKISQGFVMSNTQQYLDQLMVSLEQNCTRLERSGNEDPHNQEIVAEAKGILEDARASRNFLSRLQSVSTEVANRGSEEIETQIKSFAKELNSAIETLLHNILEDMIAVGCTECPNLFNNKELSQDAKIAASKNIRLPKDFVKKILSRTLDSEIAFKVEEISLDLASSVSDSMFDSLLSQLDASLQRLTKSWTRLVRAQKRNTAASTTSSQLSSETSSNHSNREGSVDSEQNGDSPVSLRKVVINKDQKESHVNRRRPRSSVLSAHEDELDIKRDIPSPVNEEKEYEIKTVSSKEVPKESSTKTVSSKEVPKESSTKTVSSKEVSKESSTKTASSKESSPKKSSKDSTKESSPKKSSPSKLSILKIGKGGKMSPSKSENSILKDSKQVDLDFSDLAGEATPLTNQNRARPKGPKQNSSKKVVGSCAAVDGSQDSINSTGDGPRCVEDIFRYCSENTQPLMSTSAISSREQTPDSLESEDDSEKKSRTAPLSPHKEAPFNPMRVVPGPNILAELKQKQENKRASLMVTEHKPTSTPAATTATKAPPVDSAVKRPLGSSVLPRFPPPKETLPVLRPISQASNERSSTISTSSESSSKSSSKPESEPTGSKPMSVKERANMITAMAGQSGSAAGPPAVPSKKPNLPPKPKSFKDDDDDDSPDLPDNISEDETSCSEEQLGC